VPCRPLYPLLEAIDITKTYGSNEVLSKVSLSVAPGEIVGLIGENGAGKSTLLNILSGVVSPDARELRRNGAPIAPSSYREASRSGIIRVFQDSALIDNLRVYENLFFGWEHFFTGRLGCWIADAGCCPQGAGRGRPHRTRRRSSNLRSRAGRTPGPRHCSRNCHGQTFWASRRR